jgi:hypothetical protein
MSRYWPMETEYGWIVGLSAITTDTDPTVLTEKGAREWAERLNVIERELERLREQRERLREQREALEEIVANLSVPSHPAGWVASALKVARERLAALPND